MAIKQFTGKGATFAINSTTIGNIKTFALTPAKWTFEDVTNLGSPVQGTGLVKEQIPTLVTPGDFKASVYYVPTDAGLAAARSAFANAALSTFSVQLAPDLAGNVQASVGDSWTFSGYVSDMPVPDSIDPTKPLTYTLNGTIETVPTFTQGS
jgi:hypothetical protein